jgi:hypothetical protein
MRAIRMRGWAMMVALATTLVAPLAHADVRDEVLASHQAMVERGKFRSKNIVVDGKATRESSAEVVWPDRFHLVNAEMEVIIVPGKTWIKQGGQWQPFPMNLAQMIGGLTPDAMRQGFENMTNAKALPDETIGGRKAHVYEYDTHVKVMGIEARSHVKAWVDAENRLLLKQVAKGEAMGHTSTTTTTYEYDDKIAVKAPL